MHNPHLRLSTMAAVAALSAFWAAPALAQDDTTPVQDNGEIVVTARAGNTAQKKVEASYAISTISEEELKMKAPIGVAEALKNVPGFWIESSSGEASGNIRVRGIPTDGYSQIALLEDGITIQHDAGLGWLNGDQAFRVDQTVQSIEVVRGGPSSLFYSNAPGAVVNFITRRGGDHLEGMARYEIADYNSHRVDGWLGGPIGNSDWRFFVGGYYRLSDGQRHTGYRQDEGGQIRGTLSREFERGSIMFGVKRIDERIGNAMVTPFINDKDGNPVGVPGFDALKDNIAGPQTRKFDFLTPNGTYDFDNAMGTTMKLTQLTAELKYDLGGGFTVQENARYHDSYTKRNSITPRTVASANDLLTGTYGKLVPLAAGQHFAFGYTNDPNAPFDPAKQNGNGLALLDLARSFTVPESEFVNDLRIVKSAEFLGHHDLAIGGYFAHVKETYGTNSASVFTDVRDNAALLDAYVVDAAGNRLAKLTNDGIASYGVEFNNANGTSDTTALYLSDEWKITDKLRLDGGFRWEKIHTEGAVEGRKTVNLGQSPTGADDAVIIGNGAFTPFSRSYDHTAWTVGANYQFQPDLGVFLRYTSTFHLPSVSSFLGNPTAQPVTQTMNFIEGGLKIERPTFNFYLTGFRTIYQSYEIDDYHQVNGVYVLNVGFGDTRTLGVELEGTWRPVSWFDIHANWTYQDPKFTEFKYTDSAGKPFDYSHNRLVRVPENQFRITPGLNLLDRRVRLEADISYYGKRYADVANQIALPAYTTLDANARFDVTRRLSLNLFAQNLTNTIGLTEGNPRAGAINNEEVGKSVYIARSIFGRSVRGAVTFRF
ncbi:TonB-dependent receptor [Sphingomonas sp. dw_22]|uniref:TonB-dependent receptor n=1 Tax=Sphingomonas sp. dw_22 TaxID=2721175 RepID=UPI001BD1FAA5|nr:TonB-dependent receptor [Sphingomonas sp. dw_22]